MKKIISIVLALVLCLTLVPVTAFADGAEAKTVYQTEEGYSFEGGTPIGTLIAGIGNYQITADLSDGFVIIDKATVTVGDDGAVDLENVILCGDGSLAWKGVTFTGTVVTYGDEPDAETVMGAYGKNIGAVLHAEGSFAPEGEDELSVGSLAVDTGKTLSIGTGANLSVGSLTVDGTLSAAQDAMLTVRAGADVSGVAFYDANTTDAWTDFSHDERFIWLETGETEQDIIQKWVRFVDDPQPQEDIEVIFPDDGSVSVSGNVATYSLASKTVTVTVAGAAVEYDAEYSARESVTRYRVFVPADDLDSVTFTVAGDFDPAMKVVLHGENNFSAELAVNEGVTTIAHTPQGVHVSGWVFFDIEENGQQENPPQEDIEVIFPDDGSVSVSGNVATYSLASKTVTVTVAGAAVEYDAEYSARESVTRYRVFVPADDLDSVTFTVAGDFDPAMKVVLHGENNFSAELAINEGVTTIAHTPQGVHVSGWVFFDIEENGQQENPPHGPEGGINWDALKEALQNYIFAYGGSTLTAEQAKTLVCKELSERRIGPDYALGEALGKDAEGLAEYITVTGNSENSGAAFAADDAVNLPYYAYSIAAADVDAEADGNQPFSVSGKVYVLNTICDVVVGSEKSGVTQYQVITLSAEEFGTTFAYIDADSIIDVYGNAAMCNGIEGGGEGILAWHMTQEHAGGINTFPIGARLVLTLEPDTVKLTPNAGGDAAPWSFQNVGVYSGAGTESDPVEATVFYGAPSIKLEKATGSKTITGVTVTNLPETAIQYIAESGVVNFRTNYDVITLKITYSDSSTGYLTLNRVGLDIKSVQADKKSDVQSGDRFSDEEKAACTGDSFNVWHGTDQSVRYAADKDVYVIGSFYYSDETVCEGQSKADLVAQHYSELNSVSLFITIEKTNGTFEYRTVTGAITLTGTAVNNGGFIEDTDNVSGYAGQGANHFYDDFVLWSGSSADFADIKSVSAIAFRKGNSDAFGGVQVGSGAGVEWTK